MVSLGVVCTGSKGNCYVLTTYKERLILDCGCDYKCILSYIGYSPISVCGALVTHEHKDHTRGLKDLIRAGIEVFGCDNFGCGRVNVVPELKQFMVGEFKVVPFKVPHTGRDGDGRLSECNCYGYIIWHPDMGYLVYATDFQYIPYKFTSIKPEHFLIECNHLDDFDRAVANYRHILRGHSSLNTVKKIIEVNNSERLANVILCHISETNGDPYRMKDEVQALVPGANVFAASKGLLIQLEQHLGKE